MADELDYSPFLPEVMADPFPFYRRLRDESPAYYLADYDAWALSRFEDVWRATERPELFTTTRGTTAAQALSKVEPPYRASTSSIRPITPGCAARSGPSSVEAPRSHWSR